MCDLYRKQFDEQCGIETRSFDRMIGYSSLNKIDPTSFSVAKDCHHAVGMLRAMLIRICNEQDRNNEEDNNLLVRINEESNRMVEILNKLVPLDETE